MKNFLIIFSIVLLISCNKNETIDTIHIDLSHPSKLKEFILDEHIIPLETNEDCLIGEIEKICIDSTNIFIMDKINATVFIYDKKGHYISKIFAHGNGPNEYIELSDMCINNSLIYILSRPNKSILVYAINGEYKERITLNDWYHRINTNNDYIQLYSCKSNRQHFDIVSIDYKGNIVRKEMPFAKDESFLFSARPFNKISHNEYLLCFPYEQRVALWNNQNCDYKYRFDFDTKIKFSDKDIEKLSYERIREKTLNKESLRQIEWITQINNNSFYLIASVFIDRKGIRKVLCKTDFNKQRSKIYILRDEINENFPNFYEPILLQDNKIYCIINPNTNSDKEFQESNPSIGVYNINLSEL